MRMRSSCSILLMVCLGSILVRAAEPARPWLKRPALQEHVLADFAAGAGSAKALHAKTKVEAREGGLNIAFPAREQDPDVLLWSGDGAGLAGMDMLRFDATVQSGGRLVLRVHLHAGAGAPFTQTLHLDPGTHTCAVPLKNLIRDGGDERIEAANLDRIRISIQRRGDDAEVKIEKLSAQRIFEGLDARWFDFGADGCFAGAASVTAKTLYDAARGFGLSGTELVDQAYHDGFPLFGDQVAGKDLAFRIDLPDGEYEVQCVAFGTNWQGVRNVSYKILANEKSVVEDTITPERFFSYELQYYGADLIYDPARTLFDQYHRTYFKPHRFEASAAGGALTLKFEQCGPRTLWIYPKAQAEAGRAFVEACYGEVDHEIWSRIARVRPHKLEGEGAPVAAAEAQRGYRIFTRNYQFRIYPNHEPGADELLDPAQGLEIACAPNEYEPVTFALRPLKDLGVTKVTFSELTSGAHKLPASAFDLCFVKEFPQSVGGGWYEPIPTLLHPYKELELKKDWNRQYWATLFVPPGTPAGTYTGSITLAPHHGEALALPVRVRVRPFDLPKTKTECGMWNNTAFGSHMLQAFPDYEPYVQQTLEAEIRIWAEHGMNGFVLDRPKVTYDRPNVKVTCEFSEWKRTIDACRKYGLSGRHLIGGVAGIVQYGLMRKGFTEFSPEFNSAYIQVLTQMRDWIKANDVPAAAQIFDEPRETELNDWNRNRRDTIKYLKLARQVEGLQTVVTLMGDRDGFNRPYTPLVPLMDIVSTHPWERSDDSIYLCAVEKIADLWLYNGGPSRLVHGYYLWKSRAKGHWQWVYSWEVRDAHIPVFHPKATSQGYAYPGGFLSAVTFEHVREGVDDHRYLELLEAELAQTPKDAPAALAARGFVKAIEEYLPAYPKDHGLSSGAEAGGVYNEDRAKLSFDAWREQLAEYIAALREKREAKKVETAWAMFPKALTAEKKQVVCKLVAQAPVVDGKADDAVWKDAEEATGFLNLARSVLAVPQTSVKAVCDGVKLYVHFTCHEPKYGELKAYAIERDKDVWMDDSVEVFLDANRDKKTYKHLIVNCLGTIQDGDGRDPLWNAEMEAAVSKSKGSWSVEFSVTLASLGVEPPVEGAVWGVNLCRSRQPEPRETSSWAWVGHSFHNPEGFGELIFKK
ncbi:MAG: hypothetical protein AMXMBFR7_14840 [Planctomycetota bacterium]